MALHGALQLIGSRFQQSGGDGPSGVLPNADDAAALVTQVNGSTPLVLDSPHSGTVYPNDFRPACDLATLRRAEDTHVEKLYGFAGRVGAAWIEAHFPRSYLDANRDLTEVDPSMLDAPWTGETSTDPTLLQKVRLGKGLIWKFTDEGVPLYDRPLSVAEVQSRIARCWRPYHAAVEQAIDSAHRRHGYSIHINCHSMPAVAGSHATLHPGLRHADFVIGDRDGSTASPWLSSKLCEFLRGLGYSVDYNHPYKGVELVRRYGDPDRQRHSIQVEINRKLYMNEQTLAIDPEGFASLTKDLRAMVDMLLATVPASSVNNRGLHTTHRKRQK